MLEVGYSEILVIVIVLIVVVGPKDLPKMLRAFGKAMTRFRQVSGDFRRQFDDALKEAELDEVRKTIDDVRKLDPRQQVRDVFNPLRAAADSIRSDVQKAVKPAMQSNPNPAPKVEAPVAAPLVAAPPPKVKAKPASKSAAAKPEAKTPAKPAANTAAKPATKAAVSSVAKLAAKPAAAKAAPAKVAVAKLAAAKPAAAKPAPAMPARKAKS